MYQGQHGLILLITSLEGSLKGSPWICAGLSQIHVSSAFCKGILKLETYSSFVLLCFTSTVVPVHHSQLMPERQTFYFQSLAVPAQQKGKNAGTSLSVFHKSETIRKLKAKVEAPTAKAHAVLHRNRGLNLCKGVHL